MNLKKYITNITGLQFFQLLRFGILLLISIVFTKSSLGTGEIGIYETFLLIAGGVSFFWTSGIIQSFLSLYNGSKSLGNSIEKKTSALFNTTLVISLFSVLAAVFVYFSRDFLANILNLAGGQIPYLKILLMYIVVSGPANLVEYVYLLRNKSAWIIKYGIISLGLQFICVTSPVLLGYDLGYGLYGLVFVNIIRVAWLGILILKHSDLKISIPYLKEQFAIGMPLILSLLLSGSAQYIDGFLVSNFYDEASFAVFRYGARELPFVILLANTFSTAMVPIFSENGNLKANLLSLKSKSLKLTHLLFPISILFLVFSKWLFPIVFNENFLDSADIFNVYLLIIISRLVFPQTILIGLRKSSIILTASFIELVVNVTLSIIFIKSIGMIGVAYATIIAYYLEKGILMFYLRRNMGIKIQDYMALKFFLIYSVLILVVYFLVSFAF